MSSDRDERRRASWGARALAPIALVAASVGVVIVVSGSLDGSSDDDEGPRNRSERTVTGCDPSEPQALRDGYYVVQPGEPGLSAVADKTCVPIDRLQRLNENLDPQAIPQGGCINLRRDGCKVLAEG